jgi:hypothetical protein
MIALAVRERRDFVHDRFALFLGHQVALRQKPIVHRLLVVGSRSAEHDRDVAKLGHRLVQVGVTLAEEDWKNAVLASALRDVFSSSETNRREVVLASDIEDALRDVAVSLVAVQNQRLAILVVQTVEETGEKLQLLALGELLQVDHERATEFGHDFSQLGAAFRMNRHIGVLAAENDHVEPRAFARLARLQSPPVALQVNRSTRNADGSRLLRRSLGPRKFFQSQSLRKRLFVTKGTQQGAIQLCAMLEVGSLM